MDVLIVVESLFGHTHLIAQSIAVGLREAGEHAVVVRRLEETGDIPKRPHLLLLGGPTHGWSMSSPETRDEAVSMGASARLTSGLRDWIDVTLPMPGVAVRTFDTRVKGMAGSAAKRAAKELRKQGWPDVERGKSFYVSSLSGPLVEESLERAERWGRKLAAEFDRHERP